MVRELARGPGCVRFCVCEALPSRSNAVWLGPVLSAEQRHGRSTSASLHKRLGRQGCSSSFPTVWHLKVQSKNLGAHQLWVHTHTHAQNQLGFRHISGTAVQVAKCWIFKKSKNEGSRERKDYITILKIICALVCCTHTAYQGSAHVAPPHMRSSNQHVLL